MWSEQQDVAADSVKHFREDLLRHRGPVPMRYVKELLRQD